jgi:superfamily II DNA or RNA helicase
VNDAGQISDFRTLLSTLSPDALTRGKQFERVTKWWLENDPVHSRQIEKVWLWDEWPEYPGRDIGIDLVARLLDGSLMAVQAKCVNEGRAIPKSELDSFVSAASSSTFKHKMLVATTDGLSANAQRMLADQHVVRVMLSDLEASVDVWPNSIDHLDQHPVQPKATPRPHQQQAISDVATGMSDHDRGQLIMACGTGKTLTALWITEQLKPAVTLVLVPSLNLLSQTLSEWSKNTTSDWSYLCVCSDDTVNKSDDQPISTVDELPFEVTTNPDDIATFLTHSGTRIIFSTYQSSARVAQAQQLTGSKFNLVICDEAHRLTGKIDADYSTVLDNSKIVAEKRLFMTATPRTYTPAAKSKAEDRGVEITSMDDETVYGPVLHKLSFGEAIKQDLLSDYRVLIVGVTDPQVQDLIDRRELVSINDTVTTDARTLAAHIGLAKATKDYNLKRTISFHSRIKSADQFAQDHIKILDWLPDTHKPEGTTWTGTISGAMNTGERRRLLTQLKQDDQDRHALLTNARCLTEGVDVPSLDGVAFIDPRSSQVDIIQAVGRAIRKSANKEIGTIVLPVLIPTDADAEHALEDTAFKPIWAILNALKSHDEELAVELNNLRTELGRTGKVGQLPDRLVEDLPADIDSILPGFTYKLSIAILEKSTQSWGWWYGLLQTFVEKEGHAKVLHDRPIRNPLATWVSSQRQNYSKAILSAERIGLLEKLPGWSWKVHIDNWDETFAELEKYLAEHGNLYPTKQPEGDGEDLGGWCTRQRMLFSRGKLDSFRSNALAQLPAWSWDPNFDRWNRHYRALLLFSQDSSDRNLPNDLVVDGLDVGRWMQQQRTLHHRGSLELLRDSWLEQVPGWRWSPTNENWNESFSTMLKFRSEYGHCLVPAKFEDGDIPLGRWVTNQRVRFRKGHLEQSKIEQLGSIEGWEWEPRDTFWETGFQFLTIFHEREGHANPLNNQKEDNFALGGWVTRQRGLYKRGQLDDEKVSLLEALNGWEWIGDLGRAGKRPLVIVPQLSLAILNPELVGEFDLNANEPFNPYNLTPQSGRKVWWICQNNSQHKWQATVSNRTQRHSGCPHCRSTRENGIQHLLKFVMREGHSRVPTKHLEENFALGQWVANRRSLYKRQRLNPEELLRLENIPGWTWSRGEK